MTRGLALASLVLLGCAAERPRADLILVNGLVYTNDIDQSRGDCVAITGEFIARTGPNSSCLELNSSSQTRLIDLGGKTVVPGFIDSHAHLSGIGFREMLLDLTGSASKAEMLARVAARADVAAAGEWIIGGGWIESGWEPPVFPTRWDLDAVAAANPVWLVRVDGHGGVANSRALELAGIDRETAAPQGGEILRERRAGEPTGMLIDRAQQLVREQLPKPTRESLREALRRGAERSLKMGWTQVSIAGNSFEEIELLRELKPGIRIYDAVAGPGPDAERLLAEGAQTDDPMLTVRGIKIVLDGALGSRGAALLEPYADHDSRGLMMHQPEALAALLERALRRGVQVQTHAIGDRANRAALDLYERALAAVRPEQRAVREPRWRIEHAQILDAEEIPRFARLEVIASMQASHAITDLHFALSRLGPERLRGAYAWRSLLDKGARIAGGSDAPVEKGDPIVEFYAAAARRDLNGEAAPHWHRAQRLTRQEALKMLTEWAAYAAFQEQRRGVIRAGMSADLTVLSGDIMTLPEQEIPNVRAVMTIVGGRVAWAESTREVSRSNDSKQQ